ncbi:MAG: alkaline phosphatase D family protein [Geminicoccaceae bacterium]|nr:alkaline phosphatase D family protein [Geminicoccaceae bacterium]MCS7267744.1 alkaline phosphatase D family protein [Geminicoccaceae bacterium]MCX7628915.1 alkaline phosphatase D family protein [Geminicoccaceae bacterium]MDW8125750.1 alkaline phosphatase D family protein [Geminicoccaceae bacterium]MDW8340341.1 alkaline phosphatase D family protein [Geminicoccaceae bacterium]
MRTIWKMRTKRRELLGRVGLGGIGLALSGGPVAVLAQAPAVIASERMRIKVPYGVQVGDLSGDRAILWAKADREARMIVEWATTESMKDARTVVGPNVAEDTDFCGKIDLVGLPPGETVFYRVSFLDLSDYKTKSEPVVGRFRTPPAGRRDVRFLWSGDTAGQGYGINPDFGGMRIYEAMRRTEPDFFIHSGDTVYPDNPIPPEVKAPDGTVWKNLTIEEKQKVAETLREFRMNYAYNLMDENVRKFNAEVPMFAQWDDHEVTNNWYWEKRLDKDQRYKEGSVAVLAARAMKAFHDYMPTRRHPLERDRIYESFRYGPSLEIFRIDMRSYRGANSDGLETVLAPETRILGEAQMRWLKRALLASDATWKVIASDMPLGLVVWDDFRARKGAEAVAQGDQGPPKGRELEIAELLRFIRDNGIKNVVWLTADVHYTAAHYYDPNKAVFQDFAPFWEFVSGPLNAGTFGPNELDRTFGPQVVFQKAPPPGQANLPPSAGLQFFGQVDIDGKTEVMTVRLKDLEGRTLFTQELRPEI